MIVERPDTVRRMLVELMRRFAENELHPLPLTTFPIAQAGDAFHAMAQARHIGKVVLSCDERTARPILPVDAAVGAMVRSEGAYLITGGLGGLGLQIAAWLVRQGAHHVVLAGRRAPSPAAEEALAALREAEPGATLHVVQLDVVDRSALAALLLRFGADLPPLRGLIHPAAVLAATTRPNLDL